MNEHYVVVKLTSGEQVMAMLNSEDESHIELAYPMVIRMLPVLIDGNAHERVVAAPLCQFSTDKYYRIPRSSVMFVKELHEILIPHYTRLLSDSERNVLVQRDKDGNIRKRAEDLDWGDEEEDLNSLTTEEIQKRIDMLESIYGSEEEEQETTYFIEGNETLH